jgi:hypothetical protein
MKLTRAHPALAVLALVVTLTLAPRAHAYHAGDEHIVDGTAHGLRSREVRVGLWQVEAAPVAMLTVGTDTAPWAAGLFLGSVFKNGHAKVRLLGTRPLTLGVTGGVYQASGLRTAGASGGGSGSLWVLPSSMFASSEFSRALSLHVGVTWIYASGTGVIESALARGPLDVAASAMQVHAMGEVRVSRVVALLLIVRAQPWASALTLRTALTDDAGARLAFEGTASLPRATGLAALAAVALSGRHMNVRLGAGYGAIFVPSMSVMLPISSVQPELDFHVRF